MTGNHDELPSTDTETIGARIRRLRLERGLSQADLAQKGVSLSYVSYLERDQRTASVKALRLIAAKLGVSSTYLEHGDQGPDGSLLADAELELRLGDPRVAFRLLDEVIDAAARVGDTDSIRRARLSLGLAHAALGEHTDAIVALRAALADGSPGVGERPDAYDALGRSLSASGDIAGAIQLYERCVQEIEGVDPSDPALFVRFSTLLSYALSDSGDTDGARVVVLRALDRGRGLHDLYSLVRLEWSLARSHYASGASASAARHFKRALVMLEQTDDQRYLACAHESCGAALIDGGRHEEALEHLEQAEVLHGRLGDRVAVGRVIVDRARVALAAGDGGRARELAVEALALLRDERSEPESTGTAWRALAELHHRLGDVDLADAAYSAAIEAHVGGAPARALADTYRSYAEFLAAVERPGEAFTAMARAADLAGVRTNANGTPARATAADPVRETAAS